MKKTKRLATWKYIVSLTVSVFCMLVILFVEGTAINFAWKSNIIKKAEIDGQTPTYVMGGTVTWTDSQIETYNNAVKAKKQLIETNDVAKFFSDLAGSTTGQIFRWIIPVALLGVLYISAKFAYAALCILPMRLAKRIVMWRMARNRDTLLETCGQLQKDEK